MVSSNFIEQLQALLGYVPAEPDLFRQALTHSSVAGDVQPAPVHNQRLEFLGDAVLDLIISEWSYKHFPQASEGQLSRLRAAVVCEPTLAKVARRLKLGSMLWLGQGAAASGGRDRPSVLAGALEALLGAVYLSDGYQAAARLVAEQMEPELAAAAQGELFADYKTELQETVRRRLGVDPEYRLVGSEGPDHNKTFHVEVYLAGRPAGRGSGRSKKEAEQEAAANVLRLQLQET